ncbi:MAG: hypothetical protein NT009_01490 [Proteobacteria bacterium]|nr:hypothetical protein [Pseudomonadota bacterium]
MSGWRKSTLAILAIGFSLFGCAYTSIIVEKMEARPGQYPDTIRVGQVLEFQAVALAPSGSEVESPSAANLPNWSVDNPENCRVMPHEGMKVTLKGVGAGPCELTLRAKVHVGMNTVIVWSGKVVE